MNPGIPLIEQPHLAEDDGDRPNAHRYPLRAQSENALAIAAAIFCQRSCQPATFPDLQILHQRALQHQQLDFTRPPGQAYAACWKVSSAQLCSLSAEQAGVLARAAGPPHRYASAPAQQQPQLKAGRIPSAGRERGNMFPSCCRDVRGRVSSAENAAPDARRGCAGGRATTWLSLLRGLAAGAAAPRGISLGRVGSQALPVRWTSARQLLASGPEAHQRLTSAIGIIVARRRRTCVLLRASLRATI